MSNHVQPSGISNPFSLCGRSAFVTGSSSGVGAAIATSLARAGANVCMHGIARDHASNALMEQISQFDVQCHFIEHDLNDATDEKLDALFLRVMEVMPDVDLLVNNAGIYIDDPFLSMPLERFRKTFRVNVEAGFLLSQAFANHWVSRGVRGRIVFTGSINGVLAEPTHVAYDASKGAVAAMVRSLCVSLGPLGIRVNSMAPGLVRTPLTDKVLASDPATLRWMQLHTPSGDVPSASVCGETAVFLLSDAAEHIHGQTLYVDGGMSAWQQPDPPSFLRQALERDRT